ncbi:hypothetical protein SAMN04489712_104522 [Thermomonospora echinospora]|uniref:Integral membrane protein n=1 Tax=Thermomonospora echinospora TaxID=1992 RepID=A0A1H5ZF56_9ACTN|nr:hypothetical protein SAMN04489712_104522 [Thermomonospora echinospora]
MAAAWCVGIGLAVLTTVTLVGWIAAPRTALGPGLPGVFRTAVNFWLVAHHAGFSLPGGRVGLLPLGLVVLPGVLLYRSGGWMIRTARAPRPVRGVRGADPTMTVVVQVALALAVPYAVLAALLALAATTPVVRPSAWQALLACLVVAAVAGGLGAGRALGAARGKRVRTGMGALLRLLPERPRSLVIGVLGALGVLVASGAVLAGVSLAMHLSQATALFDELAPGVVGGALLLLIEVVYLPNAVIWGMAYAVGPGFAVGTGTSVSPTGVFLDMVPSFPPLAALPEPGPAPALSLLAVATPFLAGAVGGILSVRAMPSSVHEAAPMWGFLTGAMTGAVAAVLAALSGGPLGGGRLTVMGPSPWRVGLMAALEVGIAAAIAAWVFNWRILRRSAGPSDRPEPPKERRRSGRKEPAVPTGKRAGRPQRRTPAAPKPAETPPSPPPAPRPPRRPPVMADPVEFEEAEPVLTPRRPRRPRVREPLDSPAPTPPEPPADRRKREEPAEPTDPEPAETKAEAEAAPDRQEPSRHRDEPERTETRGGAIYVLRDEPAED